MLGVCFVFEIVKSFLRSLHSMVNRSNNLSRSAEGVRRTINESATVQSNTENKLGMVENAIHHLKGTTQNADNLLKQMAAKKKEENLKKVAELYKKVENYCEKNPTEQGCGAHAAPAAPAEGGARKSRKHKRTRKHMRKHTRKHKVMKSKMTKSKSKKVMQKGGKYGAHGPKMNEFREKRQEDTRKSLDKVRGLRVARVRFITDKGRMLVFFNYGRIECP